MGPLSAAVGYALRDYIEKQKVFRPSTLSSRARTSLNGSGLLTSLAPAGRVLSPLIRSVNGLCDRSQVPSRIAMIGFDFAFGWEVAGGFQRTFEERLEVRWSKSSGHLWALRTSARISPSSSAT